MSSIGGQDHPTNLILRLLTISEADESRWIGVYMLPLARISELTGALWSNEQLEIEIILGECPMN